MTRYRVVEKFVSINGEGVLSGQLAVFIRFQGCNLACSYCDTNWANQEDTGSVLMTGEEIYHYVKETGVQNVTLTGGEPLLQDNMSELIRILASDSVLHVEIETNGSIDLSAFADIPNAPSFTMDYKLPGSGMESKMLVENFKLLAGKDTVKFVVSNIEDLERTKEIIDKFDLAGRCHVYISPVYGNIDLKQMVNYMKIHNMNRVTMQLQLHKIIWDPNKRGV